MDWKKNLLWLFGFDKNFNHFGTEVFGSTTFGKFNQRKVLDLVLQNPAMVKVIALQCDLFSQGKFYYYENDKEKEIPNEIKELLEKPNYQQTISQILWDWMFWNMMGSSWIWVHDLKFKPKLFVLNTFEIDLPDEIEKQGLILSEETIKELKERVVSYNDRSGKVKKIPYKDLIHFLDLTNSPLESINGVSRLMSLYKVIINSEEGLKSKNINTRFSGKFLVSGTTDVMDVSKRMLSTTEKDDIETKIGSGDKQVHALKSMVDIKRFVEDIRKMELSKQYLDDYFIIGNMYNIPRDVLEAYNSSTYENQEKARAMHVSYTLDPKGIELGKGIADFFGVAGNLVLSWDHLPFVQVLEKDREETKKAKLENFKFMLDLGIDQEEAMKYVDLKFKNFDYEKPRVNQEPPEETGAESEQEDSGDD